MREIKFRAKKNKDYKWWVHGTFTKCNLWNGTGENNIKYRMEWLEEGNNGYFLPEFEYIDPETLGQYTGLKDKNGVEIYEGDIIKYKNNIENGIGEIKAVGETSILAIYWKEQNTDKPTVFSNLNCFMCPEEIEIIGNIHEG